MLPSVSSERKSPGRGPAGSRIVQVLAVPSSTEQIVRCEGVPLRARNIATLFRCRADGSLVWTAEMPAGGDATYVAVEFVRGELEANTWDGRRVSLDLNSGRIRATKFVK